MIDEQYPFFTQEKLIAPIVQVFSRVSQDISFMSYARYHMTGQVIFLSRTKEVDVEIFKQNLLPSVLELENNLSRYVFLSAALPLPEAAIHLEKYQRNIEIYKQCTYRHRLYLIVKSPGFVESLGFNTQNNDVLNTYMNQVSLLERFYEYFCREAKDLITAMDAHSVPFDISMDGCFTPPEERQMVEYRRFLQSFTHQKSVYLNQGNKQYAISPREFECLYWCAKDKTAKQIAQIIKVSPRTIETYLINLKNKLNCDTKIELIDFAQNDSLVRFFSE